MIDQAAAPRRPSRFAGETLAYGIGSAATALVSVIAVPILTRLLAPAAYGTLDVFSTLLSILTVLTGLGLTNALVLYYRRAEAAGERHDVASSAFTLMSVASVSVGSIGAIAFGAVAAASNQPVTITVTGVLTFLWLPVNVVGSGALDLLRAQFRAPSFAILSVTRAAAATLLGVILVAGAGLDVAGVIGGQVIAGAGFTVLTLALVRADLSGSWRADLARRMVRFGLPLIPAGIAAWVMVFSNRYFLLQFRSLDEVGIYALAARIAAVLTIATVAVNSAWVPYAVEESRRPGHRSTYARAVAVIAGGLVLAATGLGLAAPEIVMLAAPPAYADAAGPVGFLALATAVGAMTGIVTIGLQLTERTASVAVAAGFAAAASLGLNLVLVPTLGVMGAALTSLAALLLQLGLTLAMAQRRYPVPYRIGPLAATIAIAVFVIVLGQAGEAGLLAALAGPVARGLLMLGATVTIVLITRRAVRTVSPS